ncbi:hypothetical protein MBANPS3_012358 [Mucor bainieri]
MNCGHVECQTNTRLWVEAEEINQFSENPIDLSTDQCIVDSTVLQDSNFRAGHEQKSKDAKFAENGVFGAGCARHGHISIMMNVQYGKGHKYMLAAINCILSNADFNEQNDQYCILYDIICLLQKTNKLETIFPKLRENDSKYALSLFHAFTHVIGCQVDYNPQYIKDFGNTDGEWMERFWSFLNRFVSMARHMHAGTRRLLLTDGVSVYNRIRTEETDN